MNTVHLLCQGTLIEKEEKRERGPLKWDIVRSSVLLTLVSRKFLSTSEFKIAYKKNFIVPKCITHILPRHSWHFKIIKPSPQETEAKKDVYLNGKRNNFENFSMSYGEKKDKIQFQRPPQMQSVGKST